MEKVLLGTMVVEDEVPELVYGYVIESGDEGKAQLEKLFKDSLNFCGIN